ncbi:hypothetical protein QBC33DRAFT_45870 [Phialemonium atrogriseum]|uniref:Serine-threonine rich protein n=1 Tax=Phialemonium atrogriseum TaxID=1093897 RepID=A0AAJ0C275_9PEZI|nr:uncharacterized protein QBC33DRAFT_45870 [Phialemonium atrogriseum]KAK1768152.1 hypothetical protein QBC33DRAFT_45870 [Phialemonium atrogriseum]
MMLTTASQLTARARCARVSALGALGSSSSALIRHRQQLVRGFRFGRIWSSHLDSEFHRDTCRRNRKLRYKYAETLNRRLLGDKHPLAEDAKAAFKRMVHDCWHPLKDPRPGRRYVNQDAPRKTPDNPTGARPGRNIEDVERGPMAHFLFGDSDPFGSPFQKASPARSSSTLSGNNSSTYAAQEEYIIDPITNRKRPRTPSDPLYPTPGKEFFKSHRSQFTAYGASRIGGAQAPIFYDGPPPEAELQKYDQLHLDLDPEPWDPIQIQVTTEQEPFTSSNRQPVLESEEYVRNHEDGSLSWKHKGISWHRSDGIVPSPSTVLQDKVETRTWSLNPEYFGYEDLDKYKPFMHNENAATQTRAPKYDDLHKYKPVVVDECEGTQHEPAQIYEDLDKYGAFKYQEPDGKPLVEEQAPMPELEKYQPVRYNEPDGKPANHQEAEVDPAELSKYQAFRYNEPDGKLPMTAEEGSSYDPAELQQYGAVRYNEPDGKPPMAEETNEYDPAELAKYQPFMYNEPDGKPPGYVEEGNEYDPKELQQYRPFMYNEPDGKPPLEAKQGSEEAPAGELKKYQAVRHNEPDGKPPTELRESPDPAELRRYEAVRWNEPDGQPATEDDFTAQSLEEFELSSISGEQHSKPVIARTYPAGYVSEQEKAEDLDLLRASDVRAAAGIVQSSSETPEEKTNHRNMLESSMTRHATSSDAIDSQALSALRESKLKTEPERKLTGNYVRDFPEEFARSWGADTASNAGLLPKDMTDMAPCFPVATKSLGSSVERQIQKAEREQVEGASFDTRAALQPALDRQQERSRPFSRQAAFQKALLDPYSKKPQGLETSYSKECAGQSTWPTYVRNYGSVEAKPESTTGITETDRTGSVDTAAPEPTLYKILAYDPTMQAIDIAETTSIVSDSASPLTPAEVLLRLSNPAKFFPHFGPLQAEGFEIVSGSGDVLVFRKVRPATAEPMQQEMSAPSINPIDMTGGLREFPSPVTSRFASPTGFVNYDLPPLRESPSEAAPRFVSGIDVRREEPVFSGSKTEPEGKPKRKLPKRIVVGAAWVAGISYALGVMGEYFKTGGVDGKGPRGL